MEKMSVQRIAKVVGLPTESMAEYERLHQAVWPTVLSRITASNIHNYSIYRYGELLFSYMEYTGDDLEADMAAMAADPETQRWWALMEPLQKQTPDSVSDEWWTPTHEVFHLD